MTGPTIMTAAEAVAAARVLVDNARTPRAYQIAARKLTEAIKLRDHMRYVERTYGLSEADWRELYRMQGGKCYICRRASGKGRLLAVDHNHLTSEVRGLLCSGSLSANTCNRLIARYSAEALQRAADYLRTPPAREVLVPVLDPAVLASVSLNPERVRNVDTAPNPNPGGADRG